MTNSLIICGWMGYPQAIVILLVVLLLFGGKKIPELMKGVGKGIKAFKEGMNDVEKEISTPPSTASDTKKEEKTTAR